MTDLFSRAGLEGGRDWDAKMSVKGCTSSVRELRSSW